MKVVLAICLLFLVSSIHLTDDQQQNHEGLDDVGDMVDGINALVSAFSVNCGKYDYKRQVHVVVANYVRGQDMRLDGQYISSGKTAGSGRKSVIKGLGPKIMGWVYPRGTNMRIAMLNPTKFGKQQLIDPQPDKGQYDYIKTSGSATGANGVIGFTVKNQKVVIFYENPWSGWPGAGICVVPPSTNVDKALYKKMYDDMNKYADTQKRVKNPTNGLYNGCIYFQDVYAAWKKFDLNQNPVPLGPFQIGGVLKYTNPNDCYVMNFAIGVRGE